MAKKAVKLELSEVMICKDIQQNRNGTFSLLGVYPKDVAVATPAPFSFMCSLWLNFLSYLPSETELEIKISGEGVLEEDVVVPVTIAAHESAQENMATPIILRNILLRVLKAGSVQISYKKPKAKWKDARTVEINIVQPS